MMEPNLCANGCGFFGSPENLNLCTCCYMFFLKTALSSIAAVGYGRDQLPSPSPPAVPDAANQFKSLTMQQTAKRKRCESCSKKVGLTGFKCRCGGLFCGRHRMPEQHACEVNYRESNPNDVNGNPRLPLIKGDKLEWRI